MTAGFKPSAPYLGPTEFSYWHPKQMNEQYEARHAALLAYLRIKVDLGDWHGVWDSAIDLDKLETEERARSQSASERIHDSFDGLRAKYAP